MRLSQPTASRIIALLEEQLGVTLFARSTRGLMLTDAGEAYLARVQPILRSLEEADDFVRSSNDLRGRSATARLIGRWPLVVAAAPSYLDTFSIPETPEALADHVFVLAGSVAGKELFLRQEGREVRVQPQGQLAIDGAEVAVSAVRAGLGIAVASLPAFAQDLDSGELVRLLPDWRLADTEAHALFAGA